uniref:Family with sequence similarity 83 member B n=1 Tax=Erpetoichthys calabaricus TaxID=27687 RepID=A0A8C4TD18_ERPCA
PVPAVLPGVVEGAQEFSRRPLIIDNLMDGQPHSSHSPLVSIHITCPVCGVTTTSRTFLTSRLFFLLQVIAIVMDIFTDVDIFKELVDASIRGVPVYILLDNFQFKSFLLMAEKQGIHIQRLRNIRVRTVKGQEYLGRSGAKFHGAMEQKFLLVDCQTVVYGSYSFMWSFEKINLSMVQVITGQLVESYDEEFRTLFARSAIPEAFAPEYSVVEHRPQRWQNGTDSVASYVSHSSQMFERRDKLRHTLDTVYMKACGRSYNIPQNVGDLDNDYKRNFGYRPIVPPGPIIQNRIQQFQSPDSSTYWKRHSYAGEKPETSSYLINNRGTNPMSSNWNLLGEVDNYGVPMRNDFASKYNEVPGEQLYQSRYLKPYNTNLKMRKSFHGTDNTVRTLKQKMPTLEHTTKSFLRSWRIESYLNNSDFPYEDSSEYMDYPMVQHENVDGAENKMNPFYPASRLRSSLVYKSAIPEQPESKSFTTDSSSSTIIRTQDVPTNTSANVYYSAIHRNPATGPESRLRQDESFMAKRRSWQLHEDQTANVNYPTNKEAFTPLYTSFSKTSVKKVENLHPDDSYAYKRHSINELNADNSVNKDAPTYVYSTLGRREKYGMNPVENYPANAPGIHALDGQRSTSEFNIKKETENTTLMTSNWQNPPLRTVSVSSLAESRGHGNTKQWTSVKESKVVEGSPKFLKKSTQKIKSLLNISDRKDNSSRSKSSSKISNSTDTLGSDDEEVKTAASQGTLSSRTGSIRSIDSSKHGRSNPKMQLKENHFAENVGNSSAPRFSTEELSYQGNQKKDSLGGARVAPDGLSRNRLSDKRVYSRFEPFCKFEKEANKAVVSETQSNTSSFEKTRRFFNQPMAASSSFVQHNSPVYPLYSGNDNKFGRLMQKFVGNLIHKNK